MGQERILWIINPIAGGKPGRFREEMILKTLDTSRFTYSLHFTTCESDGYEMVKSNIDKFDGFIAVGGDGTVNEVFKAITGTNKWFSIIPCGSGNGLARALGIPINIPGAIRHLNNARIRSIDYALINKEPFINVSGIGFDALIANKFRKSKERGLKTYAEITLQEFAKMKARKVKISFDGITVKRRVLMVSFANSSQFGNNAHIAPRAKLNDGKLHIVAFKKFHWLSLPYLTWLLFSKAIDRSKLYTEYVVEKATITTNKNIHLHIDGEARGKVKKIKLSIIPQGVKVMA